MKEKLLIKYFFSGTCLMLGISSLIPLPALAKDVMNISVEQQSTYQVRGQVTDANKEPLIGVVVSVEDTKHPIRVTTDLDGMYVYRCTSWRTFYRIFLCGIQKT